jgi:hypothetical protein
MLDDVQRGRFLEQPARENLAPFVVGTMDDKLDERPGKLVFFPWFGLVAGFQADNGIPDMNRVAGPHPQIARQAVTFVQYADDRNPFGHRRRCRDFGGRWLGRDLRDGGNRCTEIIGRNRSLAGIAFHRILDRGGSRCQPDSRQCPDNNPTIHAASGLQAS